MKINSISVLACIAFITCGCATERSLQSGPDAEVTFDGLYRVNNSAMEYAWAKPDINLGAYTKILPLSAGIEYRAVRGGTRYSARSGDTEFPLNDEQKARLEEAVSEVFRDELGKSEHFKITDKTGPDVLLVRGELLDVVSKVPPEPIGRGNIYLTEIGEATLVLELRDSQSLEIFARAADRRAAEPATGGVRSSPVTSVSEVRRLARRWARLLREGLDEMHGI